MDINKIYNAICKFMSREIERTMESERRAIRGCSSEKFKRIFENKDNLAEIPRKLIEEEARRRGMH